MCQPCYIGFVSVRPHCLTLKRQIDLYTQGCALRKNGESPVLWTCEIQGPQHMISMEILGFSSCLGGKLGARGHWGLLEHSLEEGPKIGKIGKFLSIPCTRYSDIYIYVFFINKPCIFDPLSAPNWVFIASITVKWTLTKIFHHGHLIAINLNWPFLPHNRRDGRLFEAEPSYIFSGHDNMIGIKVDVNCTWAERNNLLHNTYTS